jgi:glutamate transport system permease protein
MRDALYEAPGPKTRRRILIGTVIAGILVCLLVFLVVRQFYVTGQLSPKYWSFFTRPTTWRFLWDGFLGTLKVAAVAGAISLVLGLVLMLCRTSHLKALNVPARIVIEFFRGVPSLLLVYFFFLVVPQYGIKMSSFWMITLPVGLAASGVLAEVFRAGVNAVPKGQVEAAMSLGMRPSKITFKIVLPQAIRFVIPSLISQFVVVEGHDGRLRRELPRPAPERPRAHLELRRARLDVLRHRRHLHHCELPHQPRGGHREPSHRGEDNQVAPPRPGKGSRCPQSRTQGARSRARCP